MRFRSTALGGLVLIGLAAIAGQQGVLLRHNLGDAKKDTYDFVFASNQQMQMEGGPGGGQDVPIEITAKMKMALDYGAYNAEAGKSDLTLLFTDIVWDMGQMGAMGGPELPKEMKATGKIDKRNRVTDLKTPDMGMRGMMMTMGGGSTNPFAGMFLEFPESAVNTGGTWNVEMPNPLAKEKKSILTATLTGEKEFEGKAAHIVSLKGNVDINGDLGEMMKGTPQGDMMGDMKILMVGKIEITGEALVDKITGKTLSMSMLMKSAQNIEMPDMGMKMNVAGSTTMKITPAKAA